MDAPLNKSDLTDAVRDLKEYIDERTRDSQTDLKEYIDERTRDLQTEVLRAFAGYNSATAIRMKKIEADLNNSDTGATKRLGDLEEIVTQLQIRVLQLESGGPRL